LADDLNTPKALAVVWEILKSSISNEDKYELAISFDEVLGLDLGQIQNAKHEIPNNIKILMTKRDKLRLEGKFEEADKIRGGIEKLGYEVKDKPV